MTPRIAVLALALLAALTGCGYRAAGSANRLPANIRTLSIPAFVNHTQTYRIEQILTTAVVQEFLTRTNYRVIAEADGTADAVLNGVVLSTQLAPVTYDSQTGRASSALVTVQVRVSLVDSKGNVLYENPSYRFREQYQVSREVSSFFEEETPAVERLSRDFARTLVSNILEGF